MTGAISNLLSGCRFEGLTKNFRALTDVSMLFLHSTQNMYLPETGTAAQLYGRVIYNLRILRFCGAYCELSGCGDLPGSGPWAMDFVAREVRCPVFMFLTTIAPRGCVCQSSYAQRRAAAPGPGFQGQQGKAWPRSSSQPQHFPERSLRGTGHPPSPLAHARPHQVPWYWFLCPLRIVLPVANCLRLR